MKKLILSGLFTVMSIFYVQAQANSDLIQWGVRAGVNFANVSSDQISPDARTGFYAGILAEVPLNERFSIQPGLYYSQQGFKLSMLGIDGTYKLDYIQIPVLFKAFIIKGLNVQVGPQLGFNINNELTLDSTMGSGSIDSSNDQIKDIDFDLVAGIGYKFDNGFFIQGHYNYGITKLTEEGDAHTSLFQVGVGYMF